MCVRPPVWVTVWPQTQTHTHTAGDSKQQVQKRISKHIVNLFSPVWLLNFCCHRWHTSTAVKMTSCLLHTERSKHHICVSVWVSALYMCLLWKHVYLWSVLTSTWPVYNVCRYLMVESSCWCHRRQRRKTEQAVTDDCTSDRQQQCVGHGSKSH